MADTDAYYDREARRLADIYEALDPNTIHAAFIPHLPKDPSRVLDVGCGSGRDAAWLARMGHAVTAVEPAPAFLAEAKRRHADAGVDWRRASLPALSALNGAEGSYDLIMLSAVWMHVPPARRKQTMTRLKSLLAPGGRIFISLRHGQPDPERAMYAVSEAEVSRLAGPGHAPRLVSDPAVRDAQGRGDVWWSYMIVTDPRPPAPGAAPKREPGPRRAP